MDNRALVIGYGNTLRGDDGLGPHVATCLAADLLPSDRRVACHELTPELAVPLSRADLVVFVDASRDRRPGEFACERIVPVPTGAVAFSHALTPPTLLALARDLYGASPRAWLLSVGTHTLDYNEGLSPVVQAVLPALRARLRALLVGQGGPAMHEYAAVEALIEDLSDYLTVRGIERVASVRLRRSSAFDDAALQQAFAMLSPGTPLEGVALDVTVENLDFACGCGHRQVITADDLIGHLFICPSCGAAREIEHTDDLVMLAVTTEEGTGGDAAGARVVEGSGGGVRCA